MNAKLLLGVAVGVVCTLLTACGRDAVSFSEDIQPMLKASCVSCHAGSVDADASSDTMGEGAFASGFSVANYEAIMAGTSLGPMVVPGSKESSSLYLVVAGKTDPAIRMPPHHDESWAEGRGVPLSAGQIEILGAWIDQGAKNN